MSRHSELKKLDKKTRNKLRHIFSSNHENAMNEIASLQQNLGKEQTNALEKILRSSPNITAIKKQNPFPKTPEFTDVLQISKKINLDEIINKIENIAGTNKECLQEISISLQEIDIFIGEKNNDKCQQLITNHIQEFGWSHAILRKIVVIRESLWYNDNKTIEDLLKQAGINSNTIAISTLIHTYSIDQNYLTIKRSILNIINRGSINIYSRTLCRIPVQPFAQDANDLATILTEVEKCSLIDVIIILKFNSHLINIDKLPNISNAAQLLGKNDIFEKIIKAYSIENEESEYIFFKQSSAWLEYEAIKKFRTLVDGYYDTSDNSSKIISGQLLCKIQEWIGSPSPSEIANNHRFTNHPYKNLTELEYKGTTTRSAIFNYWLENTNGEVSIKKEDLLKIMGLTRDLARTIPINATRIAAKLAKDPLIKLIFLLLLAKRSKNELDHFHLRKILEEMTIKEFNGSLVKLLEKYNGEHPYVSDYIYEITTEDFLAKLNKVAPHRADIPEIRATLHEWMAKKTSDDNYLQRARAVRIDHQLNRIRNEIDDNRIYVDPSRFSSWIEDEMMIDLNSALTSTGSTKKGVSVNCDETLLTDVIYRCYIAFCSNATFGIAAYIGRRIRHGTFHGHIFSRVINQFEKNNKFQQLYKLQLFSEKWQSWKICYHDSIEEIIKNRLHINSRTKPQGLLQPGTITPQKYEIAESAAKEICSIYTETKTITGIDQIIIDYCWRLAGQDLTIVTRYLKSQQNNIKHPNIINDLISSTPLKDRILAQEFKRELTISIDMQLNSMLGWFKRPSMVAPKASLSLLFDAIIKEIRDTIPDFNPPKQNCDHDNIELVGGVYHIVYDSLAVIISNAAKYGDRTKPVNRSFSIKNELNEKKSKYLIVDISSTIHPNSDSATIATIIEQRKAANFDDANLYQGKSGIPKLMQLASIRQDFFVEQLAVVGNEVKVRLRYVLAH